MSTSELYLGRIKGKLKKEQKPFVPLEGPVMSLSVGAENYKLKKCKKNSVIVELERNELIGLMACSSSLLQAGDSGLQ